MSKTIGNVYDPTTLLDRHGADPLRYYLLSKISPFSDGDFSEEKFYAAYSDDLANGLGNTVSRVAALAEKSGFDFIPDSPPGYRSQIKKHLEDYRFDFALGEIWSTLRSIDQAIEKEKPWETAGDQLKIFLTEQVAHLRQVGYELQPFLPETAKKIISQFKGPKIRKIASLFPRIDS
jgi:methionyl-tRNA synthetase